MNDPFELVAEIEELGLRIETAVLIQGDTYMITEDGVEIWVFDSVLELEPRVEYNDTVYFTDGSESTAVKIVNAAEAILIEQRRVTHQGRLQFDRTKNR